MMGTTPLKNPDALTMLEQVGAIITNDHIVYTSGRHGSSYVNKDALYPHTEATSALCREIAAHVVHEQIAVEVVAGPTVGGVIMAQWVAHHLHALTGHEVLAVYAEEDNTGKGIALDNERSVWGRVFRRGYSEIVAGRRVLVVEDVLTTGGSARSVVVAVQEQGGTVVGLGALCNRGSLTAAALDVPDFFALVNLPLESWEETACPLCRQSVPVNTRIGKGAAFLARQQQQP